MLKKITRRLWSLSESLPYICGAFFFEYAKQPWAYIVDSLFCSVDHNVWKTNMYIDRYFSKDFFDNFVVLNLKEVKIVFDKKLLTNIDFLHGILLEYFDIIYPTLVKFPVPSAMIEGPYQISGFKVEKGDVVLDCGANVGLFSFFASKLTGETGKVYAIEPIPEAIRMINESMRYNNSKNIHVVEKAVGNSTGKISFNFSFDQFGASNPNLVGTTVIVEQTTIDSIIEKEKIVKVDFIKMDIEGAERNALLGAEKTIKKFKPRLAICTYHLPDDRQVIRDIILSMRNDYNIVQKDYKLFAW